LGTYTRESGPESHLRLLGRCAVSGREVMKEVVGSVGSVCWVQSGESGGSDALFSRPSSGGCV
jgi:hypothetical protein